MRRTIPILFALAMLTACGPRSVQPPAEPIRQGLATALAATNAARETFGGWDEQHQVALAYRGKTREETEAMLADYRARRADVVAAFALAYTSIAAAEVALELKDQRSVALAREALAAAIAVRAAIAKIQEGT